MAERLHILHVVRRGLADGGMENGIVNVANRLQSDRFRVSVCALDKEETFSKKLQTSDSEFYLLPKMGKGIDWKLIWKLREVIRHSKASVVHSHNWGTFLYSVIAANLAGVTIVHGEHGKNEHEIRGDRKVKALTKSLLGRRIDKLITVSRPLAIEWANCGVPEEAIQYVPNGVDTVRFRPGWNKYEVRTQFGLPEDAFLVGSVGRLDRLKNQSVLIDALRILTAEIPKLCVALMGGGPLESDLRDQVRRSGLVDRVFFIGHGPNPEQFLGALDVFALPSMYEGMSNVLLEAMATGLPVVCADIPGHQEVFETEEEGLIVNPCTGKKIAEVLTYLHKDSSKRELLGCAARNKIVQRFSISSMVENYEKLYESCGTS